MNRTLASICLVLATVLGCSSSTTTQAPTTSTPAADSGTSGDTDAGTNAVVGLGGDPYTTATSTSGGLVFELRTSPNPPPRGTFEVELTVKNTAGLPQDDLTISVVPWMPAMGHGSATKPVITPKGGGLYQVTNVSLFMGGRWELCIGVTAPVTDNATASVNIP